MARVAGGIGRYATSRALRAGKLNPDAAGALRAVVAGGTVTERTARKWNGGKVLCPHCRQTEETTEHR
eukprot:9343959-Lingulodinium_polyedra.AAC.1